MTGKKDLPNGAQLSTWRAQDKARAIATRRARLEKARRRGDSSVVARLVAWLAKADPTPTT